MQIVIFTILNKPNEFQIKYEFTVSPQNLKLNMNFCFNLCRLIIILCVGMYE